jgi:hypothetical protein
MLCVLQPGDYGTLVETEAFGLNQQRLPFSVTSQNMRGAPILTRISENEAEKNSGNGIDRRPR